MNIPDSVYVVLGTMIVANIGAISAAIFAAFKITYSFGKLMRRFEETESAIAKEVGAREMGVRAHKRIDKVEEKLEAN